MRVRSQPCTRVSAFVTSRPCARACIHSQKRQQKHPPTNWVARSLARMHTRRGDVRQRSPAKPALDEIWDQPIDFGSEVCHTSHAFIIYNCGCGGGDGVCVCVCVTYAIHLYTHIQTCTHTHTHTHTHTYVYTYRITSPGRHTDTRMYLHIISYLRADTDGRLARCATNFGVTNYGSMAGALDWPPLLRLGDMCTPLSLCRCVGVYVGVCVCIHTHIRTFTRPHVHTHTYTHTRTLTLTHAHMRT